MLNILAIFIELFAKTKMTVVSRFIPVQVFQIGPLKYLQQLPEYGELILATALACHGMLASLASFLSNQS